MSNLDKFDLIGGLLNDMDETHGQLECPVPAEERETVSTAKNTVPPEGTASAPEVQPQATPSESMSQLDQLAQAITALSRNFQAMQEEQKGIVANLKERDPPPRSLVWLKIFRGVTNSRGI